MVAVHIDGFDKYQDGYGIGIIPLLTLGEWTSITNNSGLANQFFTAGAYQGLALGMTATTLSKTLDANYSTLIFGVRIMGNIGGGYSGGVLFGDSTSTQCSVIVNSVGQILFYTGDFGTLLATSTASITENTWHYLEGEITFNGSSGSYIINLDGETVLNGSGVNTITTAHNYANIFQLVANNNNTIFDDLYLFDNTGSENNAMAGDTIVETGWPIGDASVQFSLGSGSFGAYYSDTGFGHVGNPGANSIALRQYTPLANCTLDSISIVPAQTNPSANYKMCVYNNSGTAPGTLLSGGTQMTGTTAGTVLTGSLTTPQSLTGGTPYWLGFITDSSVNLEIQDTSLPAEGYVAGNTYSSGVPGTAPSMTGLQASWLLWGNVTTSNNWMMVQDAITSPLTHYLTDSTVGHEDRYNFPSLTSTSPTINAVKVSALAMKSDGGSRSISLMTKSGTVDDPGNDADQPLTASYTYLSSIWNVDPNTDDPWTVSGVNNATSGVKITG